MAGRRYGYPSAACCHAARHNLYHSYHVNYYSAMNIKSNNEKRRQLYKLYMINQQKHYLKKSGIKLSGTQNLAERVQYSKKDKSKLQEMSKNPRAFFSKKE